MKKHMLVAMLMLLTLGFMPNVAFATRYITFVNQSPVDAYVAIHYKHSNNGWMTEGWWFIQAYERASVTLNSNNNIVYIYGQNISDNRYWRGEENDSGDRSFTVVGNQFEVLGSNTPRGKDRKKELFNKATFRNHSLTYTFYK